MPPCLIQLGHGWAPGQLGTASPVRIAEAAWGLSLWHWRRQEEVTLNCDSQGRAEQTDQQMFSQAYLPSPDCHGLLYPSPKIPTHGPHASYTGHECTHTHIHTTTHVSHTNAHPHTAKIMQQVCEHARHAHHIHVTCAYMPYIFDAI